MPDDRKQCWLMKGCPSRTGGCYSCVPDGDDCPIWRWFKKQIVVQCKDCEYALFKEGVVEHGYIACTKPYTERWQVAKPDNWFCADGKRKEGQ